MKQLALHGPAKTASRNKLIEQKLKFDQNSIIVFEEGTDSQTILGSLATPSLFADERLIILENPPEDFVLDASFIIHNSSFILWFDHEVSSKKPILEWVKKAKGQILFFPEAREISVFPFLDYLAAKDKRAYLELNKLKMIGFDMQYFITMVFYLLRNLAATPKNAPQFVKDKLIRQRRNFTLGKIASLYKDIIEIDFKIKSGNLEKSQAEFLLVNLFCH